MKFIVYKQYFTVRAKIEPTPLGSNSYEGEKSRANPRVGSYGQFQKYAREKADPIGLTLESTPGSTLAIFDWGRLF